MKITDIILFEYVSLFLIPLYILSYFRPLFPSKLSQIVLMDFNNHQWDENFLENSTSLRRIAS